MPLFAWLYVELGVPLDVSQFRGNPICMLVIAKAPKELLLKLLTQYPELSTRAHKVGDLRLPLRMLFEHHYLDAFPVAEQLLAAEAGADRRAQFDDWKTWRVLHAPRDAAYASVPAGTARLARRAACSGCSA